VRVSSWNQSRWPAEFHKTSGGIYWTAVCCITRLAACVVPCSLMLLRRLPNAPIHHAADAVADLEVHGGFFLSLHSGFFHIYMFKDARDSLGLGIQNMPAQYNCCKQHQFAETRRQV